jgi:flagellar basal body-associated protein FliL
MGILLIVIVAAFVVGLLALVFMMESITKQGQSTGKNAGKKDD